MMCTTRLVVLFGLFAACFAECDLTFLGGKFPRCASLTPLYDVYWSIKDNNITIALNIRDNEGGWLGFGISENGGMRGADIAVARKDATGNYIIEDRFVPGLEGMPKLDNHQDTTLLSSSSDPISTTIVYTRYIVPCDKDEDVPILEKETQTIFAFGKGAFGYHENNRGSISISFHTIPVDAQMPTDAQTVQILSPNYEIPAVDTTYACTPIELPSDQKYHVVRWRPVIQPGHEEFVHHMIIYACPSLVNSTTWSCGITPPGCAQIMIIWTVGQYGNDWMGDYALPIGQGSVRYGVLQMHYNNPKLIAGVRDSSGLALTYTSQLRGAELSSFIIATVVNGLVLPALDPSFELWAECPTECTKKLAKPLYVVNYSPHMHTVGKKVWMQHIRNGVELPEIHRDNHYDFTRQQSYNLNVTIMPGDRLRLHCVWDTSSRPNITIGGESTSTEMCSAYIQFWPAVPIYPYCSNFGKMNTSNCGGIIPIAPFAEYTPLPPVASTCNAEDSASVQCAPLYALILLLAVLSLF